MAFVIWWYDIGNILFPLLVFLIFEVIFLGSKAVKLCMLVWNSNEELTAKFESVAGSNKQFAVMDSA